MPDVKLHTLMPKAAAENQLARIFEHGRPEALENLMLYLRLQTLFIDLKPGIVENINTLEQLTAQIDGHLGYVIEQWGGGVKPVQFEDTALGVHTNVAAAELDAAQARRAKALECAVHLMQSGITSETITNPAKLSTELADYFLRYIETGK